MFEALPPVELDAILDGQSERWPYCSIQHIGTPSAKGDFWRHALDLCGEAPKTVWTKAKAETRRMVDVLYLRALYEPGFVLPVTERYQQQPVGLQPGHIWGSSLRGPCEELASPKVLVVNRCPVDMEISYNCLWSGNIGDFIVEAINRLGYSPAMAATWYLTNVVRWPNINPKGSLRPAWVKDCEMLLNQELRILQPDYILCVGSEATKLVCKENVTKMVGRWVPHTFELPRQEGEEPAYHTAKVYGVLNPGAVMSSTDKQGIFDKMFGDFLAATQGRRRQRETAKIQYIYNQRDLKTYVDWVLQTPGLKKVAVDAEWHKEYMTEPGAYMRSVQLCHDGATAAVIMLHNTDGTPTFMPDQEAAAKELLRLLDRDDVMILGQFLAADAPCLYHMGCDILHRLTVPDSPEKMRGGYAGYYDTGYAAHAYDETGQLKLETLCSQYLNMERWDVELGEWKAKECATLAKKDEELEGYGACPDHVLGPYSAFDVIGTWRLADFQMREGGQLDADKNGCESWTPFWRTMRAASAFIEMRMEGVCIDLDRFDDATDVYTEVLEMLETRLRQQIRWPRFNYRSTQQCRELLFGTELNGKRDSNGNPVRVRPEGAVSLGLMPIVTTGKIKKDWTQVVAKGEEHMHDPCTDKETLGILGQYEPTASSLRDVRFISKILESTLRRPEQDESGNFIMKNGRRVYRGGIAYHVQADGRVRSTFLPTTDTGRARSARPNLQVFAKRRESDYARIAGDMYPGWPLRSMVVSEPYGPEPTVLVETDYAGAELYAEATQSGDLAMIDHCERSLLPDTDPNHYDIHANIAVRAFQLNCAPTKRGLKEANCPQLRVAAKNVIFGIQYGRGADALSRQCHEENAPITPAEAQQLIDLIFSMYPNLAAFHAACRDRVDIGWMRNAKGRLRRFIAPRERGAYKAMGRQAMNFPCQSLVADSMDDALHNMKYHPQRGELGYRIVLQVHDSSGLLVPIRSLDAVYEKILPECMVDRVGFYACDLDGVPRPGSPLYHFGIETKVFTRWGVAIKKDEAERLGINPSYCEE